MSLLDCEFYRTCKKCWSDFNMVCEFSIQNFCSTAICHWIVNIGLRLLIFQTIFAGWTWMIFGTTATWLFVAKHLILRSRTVLMLHALTGVLLTSWTSSFTLFRANFLQGGKCEKVQHFLIIWIWPSSSFDEHLNAWFLRKGLHWKKSKPAQRNWICCGGISLLLITGWKENEP